MRVQPSVREPLQALHSVLQSVESVRNGQALYLLLLSFALSGMLVAMAQRASAAQSALGTSLGLAAAGFVVFYGSNATGILLMDEAQGRPQRSAAGAVAQALRCAHRLLLVVLVVLVAAAGVVALCWGLVHATRLPGLGPSLMAVVVPVVVPALGLVTLAMVGLVGPVAAPAVWFGLRPLAVLALLARHARRRFAHVVLLAAAVSLLSAAVAGLVSFVVLVGARLLLALSLTAPGVDLAPQALMASLLGMGLRLAPDAEPLSAHSSAAMTGGAMVFALGLVLPAVVYLRGMCELFLALRRDDDGRAPAPPGAAPAAVTPAA